MILSSIQVSDNYIIIIKLQNNSAKLNIFIEFSV